MNCSMGIDIGTFESKGVLVDGTGGIIAQASRPHKMLVPSPGRAEHRANEDWWGDFVEISNSLIAKSGVNAGDISSVAASAIGPCMLPVDIGGNPLTNGVLYGVDTRASEEIKELNQKFGEEQIFERCGNSLTSQSVGPKILWLRKNQPEIFAKTHKILTSTSFLVFKLTGRYVIDHYTAAGFTPLYDIKRNDWAFDLMDGEISADALPEILWSDEIAGTVSSDAARESGLKEETPVTTGTVDAASEALSVGLRSDGDMMLMYGSTIFIIQKTHEKITDPRLWYAPWLTKGTHASMAGQATSGTLTHWFKDELARELPEETAFEKLMSEAAGSPAGANGLIFLPYFSGERTPIHDPHAKGCYFGLNLTHKRGDLYRALIEGIAFGTAHTLETYEELGCSPKRVLAVGGGTKNQIWLNATSSICGLEQLVLEKSMGASYGDAFLAACAVGSVQPNQIEDWNPVIDCIKPDKQEIYDRHYRLFRNLYEQTKQISFELDN